MLNAFLLAMNNDDYSHLLEIQNKNNGTSSSSGRGGSGGRSGSEEDGEGGEDGHQKMMNQMMGHVTELVEVNPHVLMNASEEIKNLAVAALLSSEGNETTVTKLLVKQLIP